MGNISGFCKDTVKVFACFLNQICVVLKQFGEKEGNILFLLAPASLQENN